MSLTTNNPSNSEHPLQPDLAKQIKLFSTTAGETFATLTIRASSTSLQSSTPLETTITLRMLGKDQAQETLLREAMKIHEFATLHFQKLCKESTDASVIPASFHRTFAVGVAIQIKAPSLFEKLQRCGKFTLHTKSHADPNTAFQELSTEGLSVSANSCFKSLAQQTINFRRDDPKEYGDTQFLRRTIDSFLRSKNLRELWTPQTQS